MVGIVLAWLAATSLAMAQNGDGSAGETATTTSESIAATLFIIRVTHANGEQTIDLVVEYKAEVRHYNR